ncbi:hypothetical protein L0663_05265 [Dyadobacter sp. CY107]|uniref:hypothetical protein n=1 Tax=Dyadobacter fanqingshengii TaxID=2906443 RepID=UPI001F471228|nr:hypothetical protein [Dyadobacter fanqingshengii]MCF2502777.1 hypothetical protein [Dyadobacter fanqingshengii]
MDLITVLTLAQVINLASLLELSVDVEKLTVDVKIGAMTLSSIPFWSVKALSENKTKIEYIVTDLFIKKAVMWQDFSAEKVSYCIDSLTDLEVKLTSERDRLADSKAGEDKLLSSAFNFWSLEANSAIKKFHQAVEFEAISRGGQFDERLPAEDEIPEILGTLRANTIKIIRNLLDVLPNDSDVRRLGEQKYEESMKVLIKSYRRDLSSVKDLSWAVVKQD